MEDYLDFGSDSDSEGEKTNDFAMDSDEEEALENEKLFKILMSKSQPRRRCMDDFEAEMEADLDQRAHEVESRGGMEHQKSLISPASSTTSLNKRSPCPSPSPSSSSSPPKPGSSGNKRGILSSSSDSHTAPPAKKSVKFSDEFSEGKSSSTPMEVTQSEGPSGSEAAVDGKGKKDEKPAFYDEIYFDSDDSEGEDEESKKKKKDKRSFMSNDDLFYDPTSDSRDQAWVDRRRRRYCKANQASSSTKSKEPTSLPTSDAILNCPACFTVLCLDCQKHTVYNQYRAMFVMNCNVIKSETLHVPLKEPKWKKKRGGGGKSEQEFSSSNPAHLPANDSFNPVKCKICRTQVAVYDSDEVYHFFNILASQG